MARVTVVINDADGSDLEITVSSSPPMPLDGNDLDFDSPDVTPAMAAAIAAMRHIAALAMGESWQATAKDHSEAQRIHRIARKARRQ